MKKIVALFAIVATTVLASCGNGTESTTTSTDSTVVAVDSLNTDSTSVGVDSLQNDVKKVEEVK